MPAVMRDDLRVFVTERDERFGERDGVRRRSALTELHTGLGIERADVVEALLVVGLRRRVALALAREHVDDHRTVAARGVDGAPDSQCFEVVTVDRTVVVEHRARRRTLTRRRRRSMPTMVRRDTVGA